MLSPHPPLPLGSRQFGPFDSSRFIGSALQGFIPPHETEIARRRAEAIERRLHQACCRQHRNVFVTLPDGWTAPAQQGLLKADSKSYIPEGGEGDREVGCQISINFHELAVISA